jgi:hypothetical protein
MRATTHWKAVTRGRFRQLVAATTGDPVDVTLYNCVVDKAPHARGGKTYLALDIGDAVGDVDLLRSADAFIHGLARPAFSPLVEPLLIVKMPEGMSYELEDGSRSLEGAYPLARGRAIDVVLRHGAFGDFGYCVLVRRVKPHRGPEPENCPLGALRPRRAQFGS